MDTKGSNNIIALDILRGLAASFVFFYHLHIGTLLYKTTGISYFDYIDLIGAEYAVPIFFILSGYCIELSVQNTVKRKGAFHLKEFYARRLKRIYIPYFFALFFSIIANYIVLPGYTLGIADFAMHLFVFQGFSNTYFNTINVVLWTISIELAFYFLYPIFFYLKKHHGLFKTLAVLSIISVFSVIMTSYLKPENSLPYRYFPISLFAAWCLGCALCNLKNSNSALKNYLFVFTIASTPFILLPLLYQKTHVISSYNLKIIYSGLPLLAFLKLNPIFVKYYVGFKIPQLIGLSSYSLYLLHEPLILLKGLVINTYLYNYNKNLLHVTGIIIIFLLCYLTYLIIEKPILNKNRKTNSVLAVAE